MYLEIYPDIIFILNLAFDFILLFLLKKVNRKASNFPRLLGAAATGAVFAVFVSVFPWLPMIIRFILMYIAASILMIRIAFGRLKVTDLLKQVVVLYLITYFVGGFINSAYYHTKLKLFMINLGNGIVMSNISWQFITVSLLLATILILLSLWLKHWYLDKTPLRMEVDLVLENNQVHTIGLIDTGNCLYDPIYKGPVILIENSLMEELLTPEFRKEVEEAKKYVEGTELCSDQWNSDNEHVLRLRFIPYQSIDKKGMLVGIILDKVLIHTGKQTICNERITAAICDNRLSTRDDYHVILHNKLL